MLAAQRGDVVAAVEDEAGDGHAAIEGRSGVGVKRGLAHDVPLLKARLPEQTVKNGSLCVLL